MRIFQKPAKSRKCNTTSSACYISVPRTVNFFRDWAPFFGSILAFLLKNYLNDHVLCQLNDVTTGKSVQ